MRERPQPASAWRIALVAALSIAVVPWCGAAADDGPGGDFTVAPALRLGGRKAFPLGFTNAKGFCGPHPGRGAPDGRGEGLREVIDGGINVVKINPHSHEWTDADLQMARYLLKALAKRGAYSYVDLKALVYARPKTEAAKRLQTVVEALKGAPALGFWKGGDEPYWGFMRTKLEQYSPAGLKYAYEEIRRLDRAHPVVTIQAPKGTLQGMKPYADVTDVFGVDIYPVSFKQQRDPDLSQVGYWTRRSRAASRPGQPILMILQACDSGSNNHHGAGYVLPTLRQERFMIYDAIAEGANGLFFFGVTNPRCMNAQDQALGFNWTFWRSALKPVLKEMNGRTSLGRALLERERMRELKTDNPAVRAVGWKASDGFWVIVRYEGKGPVTYRVSDVPARGSGEVYTQRREVSLESGAFSDRFNEQWGVHVYRFPSGR